MGPFGLPWPTFTALLVVLASVVISIVWSKCFSGSDAVHNE